MFKLVAQSFRQNYLEALSVHIHNVAAQPLERQVQEIQIPVPWGHVAGKWWGSQDSKPVLCIHGYQDNAGTWDTLAPLLPHDISLLAVDLPGHGLSSHFPPGAPYHILDYVLTLRRITDHFGWDKVSLLGHSFGSIQSFLYATLYPELVEHYIALDAIKPIGSDPLRRLKKHAKHLDQFLQLDSLDPNNKPSYTYDEAVDRLHESIKKWASREACEILTRRGTVRLSDGKYCFSRDTRLKAMIDLGYTHSMIFQMAASIKCKVLNIKAKQGLKFETPEENIKFLETIKESAAHYEYHEVEGAHHVHLDFPERVAPIISDFLKNK